MSDTDDYQTITYCCEDQTFDEGACGQAVTYTYEDEAGKLWTGNGEYESNVNYCPFCGRKAKTPAASWRDELDKELRDKGLI